MCIRFLASLCMNVKGDISTDPLFLMVQNVMSLQTLKDLDPDAGVIGHLVTDEMNDE